MIVSVLLCGLAWPSGVWANPVNPHLERAKKLVDAFKDQKALEALEQALKWHSNTQPVLAEIHLYRGIAYYNLLKPKRAREALQHALTIMPTVDLPPSVSPKIQQLFEKLKASQPPPPDTPPKPPDGSQPPERQPERRIDPDYTDDRPIEPSDDGLPPAINWPAWIVLSMSLAAGGAGIGLGISARSSNDEAANKSHPWVIAETHYLNASDRALGANILFGVAGAAAVTAAVLFWTGSSKSRSRAVSVSPGNVMIGGSW